MTNLLLLLVASVIALTHGTPIDHARFGRNQNSAVCEPRPPRDGKCWKDVLGLQWTVHGFDYHADYTFTNPAHQNSWGYVNFNLTNNLVPYTAVCAASSSQLTDFFYGTMDYNCTLPATAPVGAAVKFRFSRPSGQLDISESAVCTENKLKGIFVVTGSTVLDLKCTDKTTETPDWKPGQIYSQRTIQCAPVDTTVQPSQVVG